MGKKHESLRRVPLTAARGISWPAIPDATHATWLAVLYQLDQSQWWARSEIESQQFRQLSLLLSHAAESVPFHAERLRPLSDRKFQIRQHEEFRQIPILTRDEVLEHFRALVSTSLPQDHRPMLEGRSSGSVGKPVNFYHTKVTKVLGKAFNLRNELWHDIDPMARIASIQAGGANSNGGEIRAEQRRDSIFPCGSVHRFSCIKPVDDQLRWLKSVSPGRIVTHPSNLAALLAEAKATKVELPELKHINTLGEVLPPEVRALCKEVWGLPVTDIYSCREANILALQCPENEHYHIQSEHVIFEVLDENDQPCKAGERGRVVVTDLHNFAMPLIRYEVGDHAELGESCSCGRTLPVLKRIWGRTRNMMVLPTGQRIWPQVGLAEISKLLPIKQIQVIQKTLREIEVKIVLSRPVEPEMYDDFGKAARKIFAKFSSEFRVTVSVVDNIPKSKSGKYEDFMSLVTTG